MARWLGDREKARAINGAGCGDRHPVLEIRAAVGRDIFRWAVLRSGFVSRRARGQRRTHAARRAAQLRADHTRHRPDQCHGRHQRGFLVHETTVAAGPFVIEDLQAASYGGDLEVRIVEANGETRRFTVPFATAVELLKSGETRYSMSLGQAMASGYRSGGPAVFEGLRRGLSNLVTAYGAGAQRQLSLVAGRGAQHRMGRVGR